MDANEIRWQQRFEHYKNALATIERVTPGYAQFSDLELDGLIQRFEYTFDLAWKVMQDYLQYVGYNAVKGPRGSITQTAQDGLIDAFVWGELLNARNELSHIYNEDKSRGYLERIVNGYLPAFIAYRQQMDAKR